MKSKTVASTTAALAALAFLGCQPKSEYGFHLPRGNPEKGRATFVQLDCTACHSVNGVALPRRPDQTMTVMLGGDVMFRRTRGELVTAIIDPQRELTRDFPVQLVAPDTISPMKSMNRQITVEQLIDLVAFLEPTYRTAPPPSAPSLVY